MLVSLLRYRLALHNYRDGVQNSILEANSVEPLGHLPLITQSPHGKFTQGWSDFERKGGKVTSIMGIGGSSSGHVAPNVASSIDFL